jgi:hypothetical protein
MVEANLIEELELQLHVLPIPSDARAQLLVSELHVLFNLGLT